MIYVIAYAGWAVVALLTAAPLLRMCEGPPFEAPLWFRLPATVFLAVGWPLTLVFMIGTDDSDEFEQFAAEIYGPVFRRIGRAGSGARNLGVTVWRDLTLA